ncbi:titin homolog [Helicoverpa armigera]|uniref:titin homolog n=1 Tax=Helicoverpa armigera TaxID=29058 RepID=UPI0030834366
MNNQQALVDQIVENLAFVIEAVPKNKLNRSTSFSQSTPLNVKIKVRKKEELLYQYAQNISTLPDGTETNTQRVRLVSSDHTIMNFDVFMKDELEKKPPRKFHKQVFDKLRPGICLGADDDEYIYMPSSSYSANVTAPAVDTKSDGTLKQTFTLSKNKYPNFTVSDEPVKKWPFGKCKPGGCLDPPFSEDKYAYKPSTRSGPESIDKESSISKLEGKNADVVERDVPRGCLDPPFSEDKYAYKPSTRSGPERYDTEPNNSDDVKSDVSRDQSPTKVRYEDARTESKRSSFFESGFFKKKRRFSDKSTSTLEKFDSTSKLNPVESPKNSVSDDGSESIITYPPKISSDLGISDNKTNRSKGPSEDRSRKSFNDFHSEPYFIPPKGIHRIKEKETLNQNDSPKHRPSEVSESKRKESTKTPIFIPIPVPIPLRPDKVEPEDDTKKYDTLPTQDENLVDKIIMPDKELKQISNLRPESITAKNEDTANVQQPDISLSDSNSVDSKRKPDEKTDKVTNLIKEKEALNKTDSPKRRSSDVSNTQGSDENAVDKIVTPDKSVTTDNEDLANVQQQPDMSPSDSYKSNTKTQPAEKKDRKNSIDRNTKAGSFITPIPVPVPVKVESNTSNTDSTLTENNSSKSSLPLITNSDEKVSPIPKKNLRTTTDSVDQEKSQSKTTLSEVPTIKADLKSDDVGSRDFKTDDNISTVPKTDDNISTVPQTDDNISTVPKTDDNISTVPQTDDNISTVPKTEDNISTVPKTDDNISTVPQTDDNISLKKKEEDSSSPSLKEEDDISPMPSIKEEGDIKQSYEDPNTMSSTPKEVVNENTGSDKDFQEEIKVDISNNEDQKEKPILAKTEDMTTIPKEIPRSPLIEIPKSPRNDESASYITAPILIEKTEPSNNFGQNKRVVSETSILIKPIADGKDQTKGIDNDKKAIPFVTKDNNDEKVGSKSDVYSLEKISSATSGQKIEKVPSFDKHEYIGKDLDSVEIIQKPLKTSEDAGLDSSNASTSTLKSVLKKDVMSVELGFHSFLNDQNMRVLRTFDTAAAPTRYPNDSVTVIRSQIRVSSKEIRIPIDSDHDFSIQIKKANTNQRVSISDSGFITVDSDGSTKQRPPTQSHEGGVDSQEQQQNIQSDVPDKRVIDLYERELMPLQIIIKELRDEIDVLAAQQTSFKDNMFCPNKPKLPRLEHSHKKCIGCVKK